MTAFKKRSDPGDFKSPKERAPTAELAYLPDKSGELAPARASLSSISRDEFLNAYKQS